MAGPIDEPQRLGWEGSPSALAWKLPLERVANHFRRKRDYVSVGNDKIGKWGAKTGDG